MRITISELRHIIREEIEAAYASEEMNEGLGKWLAGAALAGGLALGAGAMKDSGAKSHDTTSPASQSETVPEWKLKPATSKIGEKINKITKDDKSLDSFLESLRQNKELKGIKNIKNAILKLQLSLEAKKLSQANFELIYWSNEIPELQKAILAF